MDTTLRKIVGMGAVVAALAFPAVAVAEPFDAEAEADYAAAVAYWGGPPVGCSSVTAELTDNLEEEDAGGEATDPVAGQSVECVLRIRPGLPSCLEKAVIYHEVGHLEGLAHSTDPNSLMYPVVSLVFCEAEEEATVRRHLLHTKRRCERSRQAYCGRLLHRLRWELTKLHG